MLTNHKSGAQKSNMTNSSSCKKKKQHEENPLGYRVVNRKPLMDQDWDETIKSEDALMLLANANATGLAEMLCKKQQSCQEES